VKGGYSLLSNFSYALLILERHEISGPNKQKTNKQTNKKNPTSSKEISNSLVISSLKISVINDDN